jgi:hypothetical protein
MKPLSFKIASFLSILLIITAIVLLITNPKKENNLTTGYFTPIIAFEFIESLEAVQQYFTVKNPVEYEKKMLLGNKLDYLFMLIYSSMLFFIANGILKLKKTRIMYLAMFLSFLILCSDALENLQIHQIIKQYKFENITSNLAWLNIFTWLKWISIASLFLLFAPYFFKESKFGIIIGTCCIACFILSIISYLTTGIWRELFAISVSVVFLLLTIYVITCKPRNKY